LGIKLALLPCELAKLASPILVEHLVTFSNPIETMPCGRVGRSALESAEHSLLISALKEDPAGSGLIVASQLSKKTLRGGFMRTGALGLILAFLVVGCSKTDVSKNDRPSQTAAVPADNSGRNERDRNDATKTSGDQSESEADRTISQNVRQAVVADDSVSTNGKNVKIITIDGTVTLRGPVKSEQEKTNIGAKAQQVAGVKRVDNQLEVAN
jgi:hyperosmotically inducible periplasmic protein